MYLSVQFPQALIALLCTMLTHCFVTLKQSRKLHADNSLVRPVCEERSKVYPIACYDGRVAGFVPISEGEEAQRTQ